MNNTEFKLTREELHLSVNDLADIWGVNPRTVQRWEQGKNEIPQDKQDLLLSYIHMVNIGVEHFDKILIEQMKKHGKPTQIILLSYGHRDYDGDYPNYRIHNAMLIKSKITAQKRYKGIEIKICPFIPSEYTEWLKSPIGSAEDTKAKRVTWASEFYGVSDNPAE